MYRQQLFKVRFFRYTVLCDADNFALPDIIYGEEQGWNFSNNFNDLKMLELLSRWTEQQWIQLLKE